MVIGKMFQRFMVAAVAIAAASFSDASDIPAWAADATAELERRGVLSGRDGDRFAPGSIATRAEATTLLVRMVQSD
ncbi:S-layer homology domain-containing protein [Paenibacillus sp. TRM 82003]|nr:S-layer homology domain-containing protein [Paenibacillus sp. TRM 82003]